ncbi:MAG: DNA polymerase III subunit delta [Opitutaceae bacterium]|jgi:DNA polymerase-3 subunit delta|nr:DNA polymerase III subunit delta [Opitutaceae bacterium]
MPEPAGKKFILVCGNDDFLVAREGKAIHDRLAAEITDEFSRETLSAHATRNEDLRAAVRAFRESVRTIPMFGGRRLVWLKDLDLKAAPDSEEGAALLEELQEVLASNNPANTAILLTAAPVDRTRRFYKWCEKNADLHFVGGDAKTDNRPALLESETRALGVRFEPGAADLLLEKVGQNTRFLIEETRKLATHAGDSALITQAAVGELTPNIAESDFFAAAEAFFSGDLPRALDAIHLHFFSGNDARPLLASLQNRNRLLIQLAALISSGQLSVGYRGIDKSALAKPAATYARAFANNTEKSPCNVFTQHPFYLSKLLGGGRLPSLRRLIANQREFLRAFEEITARPNDQETVIREMAVRCLA